MNPSLFALKAPPAVPDYAPCDATCDTTCDATGDATGIPCPQKTQSTNRQDFFERASRELMLQH